MPRFAILIACLAELFVACTSPVIPADANNQHCPLGTVDCAGECVSIMIDDRHCGGCNRPCAMYATCMDGRCELNCPPTLAPCGGECVNVYTNPAHCGDCDQPCPDGIPCERGQCIDKPCVQSTIQADAVVLPADIIMVIDNSLSMFDEVASVQASMYDFVHAVTSSGVDIRVILISGDASEDIGVCIPAPVGSGSCPDDENLPLYRHVPHHIASTNALQVLLSTYEEWSAQLRPHARKSILVISDDDTSTTGAEFSTALLQVDPTFAGFKFSGIISPYTIDWLTCLTCDLNGTCTPGGGCDPCCGRDSWINALCVPLPASDGRNYREIIQATGGMEGNLCMQDFLPIFQDLAAAVITGSLLSCTYEIPQPPEGEQLDYNRINLEYQPSPGEPAQPIYHVPGGQEACGIEGGWTYDNPDSPEQIQLCPATCHEVTAHLESSITITYGCTTIVR